MRCPSAATFLLFLTIVSLALPHGSSVYADERVDLMKEYFDLVVSGNYESATHLWTESAQERSSRFGIEYAEIPVKLDCVSPIIQNLAVMRDYLYVPVKETTMLPSGDFTTIRYSQLVDGELVEHTYWAWYDSTYYWLTYPQDYYARGWPVETSRYLRIHAHPSVRGYLNAAVLREADAFIERTARSLGLGDDELRMLAERKIEYFYVDSDETIQAITGRLTKGTYDLASDDILSAFFPHHHELTHLLVNIRLRRLPLYTQPILQEGLAVHYGGRWGKSPEALTDLGVFLIREKLVELDSIMTFDGFRTNAAADIAYPVAGLFASFVLERLGTDDYLKLYLKQSGNFEAVRSMSAGEVKDALTEALGEATWSDVVDRFDGYMDRISTEAAYFLPGRITDG
ncbi:MAG: hypothetical protein OEW00_10280, partial [candidate division Zixibacteria bacterium]|nr:hypothetical protein [candidate division Zixibacteria bacterium]